jgi:hypothetical protein
MTFTAISTDPGNSDISSKVNTDSSVTKLLLGMAALALGQALQSGNGYLTFNAFIWLSISLTCAGVSMAFRRLSIPRNSKKIIWIFLITGLVWQFYQLLTMAPGASLSTGYHQNFWQFQICIILGGVCAVLSLAPKTWFPAWARSCLVILTFFAVMMAGIWIIRTAPKPFIDVYMFQQTSSEALLQGHNPYELTPPNIYGNMDNYGAKLVKNGKLTIGNPYPPLSIYLSLLSYAVTGDIRYIDLVAILIAGILMVTLRSSREALLAVYIFIFTPRIYFVIEQSWTEPLVLLLAVAVVWCAMHRPPWKYLALGLMVATKQYMVFMLPLIFLLISPGTSKRILAKSLGWSVGSAFVVTAPLAFWNFPAFLWDVGLAQLYQVPRFDALSYANVYARIFGKFPSQFLSLIILGVALILFLRYCEHSSAAFAYALGLGLGLFFAFSKQAFCNYYFLIIGLFCCALAALPASESQLVTGSKTNSIAAQFRQI